MGQGDSGFEHRRASGHGALELHRRLFDSKVFLEVWVKVKSGWADDERLLCIVADELHERAAITDDTWAELCRLFDDQRLIQVVMLVGYYHLVSFVLNGLRVPLEEGAVGFGG